MRMEQSDSKSTWKDDPFDKMQDERLNMQQQLAPSKQNPLLAQHYTASDKMTFSIIAFEPQKATSCFFYSLY